MGLFFEKRKYKSTKPFIFINVLMVMLIGFVLLMGIINNFEGFYVRLTFILVGVSFIIGLETYLHKEKSGVYLSSFGIGVLFIVLQF